jgi:hypothetical protein
VGDRPGSARAGHGAVGPLREAVPAVGGGHRDPRPGVRVRRLRLGLRRHGRAPGRRELLHVLLLQGSAGAAAAPGAPRPAARHRAGGAAAAGAGGQRQRRRRAQPGGRRGHPGVRVPPQAGGAGGAVRGVHQRRAGRGDGAEAAGVRAHVPRAVRRRVAARARHVSDVPRRRQGRRRRATSGGGGVALGLWDSSCQKLRIVYLCD